MNRWEPENVLNTLRTGHISSVQVIYNIFDQARQQLIDSNEIFNRRVAATADTLAEGATILASDYGLLACLLLVPEPPWKSSDKGGEAKGCDSVGVAARFFFRCPSPRLILFFIALPLAVRVWVGSFSLWDPALVVAMIFLFFRPQGLFGARKVREV